MLKFVKMGVKYRKATYPQREVTRYLPRSMCNDLVEGQCPYKLQRQKVLNIIEATRKKTRKNVPNREFWERLPCLPLIVFQFCLAIKVFISRTNQQNNMLSDVCLY